jgi:hypothetical protein
VAAQARQNRRCHHDRKVTDPGLSGIARVDRRATRYDIERFSYRKPQPVAGAADMRPISVTFPFRALAGSQGTVH